MLKKIRKQPPSQVEVSGTKLMRKTTEPHCLHINMSLKSLHLNQLFVEAMLENNPFRYW